MAAHPTLSVEHRRIISGAFEISDRLVRQILVPRGQVFALRADDLALEAAQRLADNGHSRAPVIGASLDEVLGIVSLRDLITQPDLPLRDVARPPVFLPDTVPVITALQRLQEEREQLAIVVDEHGGTQGLISVEDLVEELVGEIYDETDPDVAAVTRLPDGALLLEGTFPIHDLDDIGVHLPEGEYTTVAGLFIDRLGRIPDRSGDEVDIGDWTLEAIDVRKRAVRRLRMERKPDDRGPRA